jgi:hypothetical protein
MRHLDYVPTRTRPARRDASTTSRLVRGTLDGTPRPRPDSYEARSTRHLDYWEISDSHDPGSDHSTHFVSPTLRQKSEHLRRLPTTSYHHGYSSNRRGSSTGVKSYFLLPIPGWEVKTCHCTHHTAHYFSTDHPRGRIRQGPYPMISGIRPYPPALDLASTQPRPTIGQQGERAGVAQGLGSFHRLILYVTMVSRDGRPFLGHDAIATSTGVDKTLPQGTPGVPASSYPIKG